MTDTKSKIPSLEKNIRVKAIPARAFEAFTGEIGKWWPLASHTLDSENCISLTFECAVGGKIFQTQVGGEEIHWGEVLEFSPPERVVFSWHVLSTPDAASKVSVFFKDAGDGMTDVSLIHSDFEKLAVENPAKQRDHYNNGWTPVLEEAFVNYFEG